MKTMAQVKHFTQILALLLAIVFLFAACGPDETIDDNSSGSDSSTDSSTVETSDDNSSGDVSSGSTDTPNGTPTSSKPGDKPTKFDSKNPYGDMSAAVKKKEVHVLMWRKYTPTEQSLVNNYQKLTGVKVRTTVTTELEYATKLVSLISGKDSPDALCISSGNFPGFVTKSMQKLSPTVFRLDDPIWNKKYMDAYKVNGNYFSVAIHGTWSCEDTAYVTYYNPYVLRECGITDASMPYKLYQQGKWDWKAQKDIATKVYAKNKNYIGVSFQDSDLLMHTAGVDFVKYNGSQFTNALGSVKSNDMIVKAWTEMSTLNADKLSSGWNLQKVVNGQVGLFSAILYGLYNEGNWFDGVKTPNGVKGLQAVPMAGPTAGTAYTPVRPKTWGVAKGAKNPEGSAYFLRYFLDPKNAKMDNTFYNTQFKEVFNIIINKNMKKSVKVSSGVIDYVNAGSYGKLLSELTNTTAANITSVLNSKKGTVDVGVKRANSDVKKIK